MTVYRNEGLYDRSNVEYRDGAIFRYDKHHHSPEMQHIDYGLGVFRPEVFHSLPESEFCDLASVYQALIAAHDLAAFEIFERFYEIGSPEGLRDTAEFLQKAQ